MTLRRLIAPALVAPALAAAIIVGGCAAQNPRGDASSSGASASVLTRLDLPAPGGTVDKASFVARCAGAQQTIKSYQTVMTTRTVTPQAGTQESTTTFQYDFTDAARPKVRSITSTGTETIYIGSDMWTRAAGAGWAHTTNSASAVVSGKGMDNYVGQVAGEIASVVYAGDEDVNQVRAHHFVFKPVVAPGSASPSVLAHDETGYWVDQDFRPVRVQTSVTTGGITSTTIMDSTQYGASFNIQAPAA
ncbi:hypothetical protein [Propionibacterium freudenreichii]|uniref:hypothetical protein n=1 Tax=Propionibacterium freudenreichii TaxID=1744 RepID=UPI0005430700|nr:hypothetical protein [Propionibacterium freudenreichii]MDN6798693.1 hypothetical protein [Propionibacterium sp.]AJQ89946.1 Hypothetical protein RM25_0214 [Propionibacterium freudenreichii subsp. freudenreichii]MCT2990633.1 hypothetical protein [Propionibacterium freudenreichii]MCT2993039.1 hypothetical protein [Propionibacterium freudenreichii]MDK9341294.1 hypothetical protein [Propionibacterium freudenreichii]